MRTGKQSKATWKTVQRVLLGCPQRLGAQIVLVDPAAGFMGMTVYKRHGNAEHDG
jgi:hypothetical protein